MKFSKNYFALIALLSLSACGYTANSSKQYVTFLAPNVDGAVCDVAVEQNHYNILPPQKVKIKTSEEDMHIECNAPGYEAVQMNVAAQVKSKALWGETTGGDWNYDYQTSQQYPDTINIVLPKLEEEKVDVSPLVQENTIEGVIESLASDKAPNDAAEDKPVSVVPGQ